MEATRSRAGVWTQATWLRGPCFQSLHHIASFIIKMSTWHAIHKFTSFFGLSHSWRETRIFFFLFSFLNVSLRSMLYFKTFRKGLWLTDASTLMEKMLAMARLSQRVSPSPFNSFRKQHPPPEVQQELCPFSVRAHGAMRLTASLKLPKWIEEPRRCVIQVCMEV